MATEPSIVMQPSGYKANVVYSELDNTSNSDFTFARASIANRYNENSLVEEMATGVPRLDYLDGSCPALLLEPQSTNLQTYSEDFSNATYTKTQTSVNTNVITSPDGTINADELIQDTNSGGHIISDPQVGITSGVEYTFSCFYKYKDWQNIMILASGGGHATNAFRVDLIAGTVSNASGISVGDLIYDIEDYGNSWYRVFVTLTTSSTANLNFTTYFLNGITYASRNFTGDGVSGVYLWGWQLEQLDFASSYIKTEGSTVTRLADECNNAGISALINSEEGVLYCEIAALADNATSRDISITDGTLSNYIVIKYYNFGSNRMNVQIAVGGVTQVNASTTTIPDITQYLKVAFKYKQNDFSFWVDGVELLTDNSGITFPISTLNNLSFDVAGFDKYFGKVRDIRVYKTALSDVELKALTT